MISRRDFLKTSVAAAGVAAFGGIAPVFAKDPIYKISLAEWSLNKSLFAGKMDHLDFAKTARSLGIDGIEYVNQFFKNKGKDQAYLLEMKNRAEGEGVQSVLIMVDGEGQLGDPDQAARMQAVENHYQWVEAAKFLGAHTIRVNGYSKGSAEEQQKLVADGMRRLVEFADPYGINIVIENHGGFSSNGKWLAETIRAVGHSRAGTLPDFGNFRIDRDSSYDSYRGVDELMPLAKGVSVKPTGWDDNSNQLDIDLARMMKIVLDHGYHGYAGIEYGREGSEIEDIKNLNARLIQVRDQLTT